MKAVRLSVLFSLILALWMLVLPVSADGGGQSAIVAQDFTLGPGDRLEDDLVVFGGRLHLEQGSIVEGDIAIMGGEAKLEGYVDGDVVAFGASVELGSTAVIEGDVVVFGNVRRHPDATIRGNMVEGLEASKSFQYLPKMLNGRPGVKPTRPQSRRQMSAPGWFVSLTRSVMTILALLFVAALVVILLPESLEHITRVMDDSVLLSLGVGVLTIILTLVLVPLLTIICIGIPLAIVLLVALLLCALIGWVAAGKLLGQKLLHLLKIGTSSPFVVILLGTLLITLLALVGCVGRVFALLLLSWSIGAVVLTRFGTASDPFWSPFATSTPTSPVKRPQYEQKVGASVDTPKRGDTKPLDDSVLPTEADEDSLSPL